MDSSPGEDEWVIDRSSADPGGADDEPVINAEDKVWPQHQSEQFGDRVRRQQTWNHATKSTAVIPQGIIHDPADTTNKWQEDQEAFLRARQMTNKINKREEKITEKNFF